MHPHQHRLQKKQEPRLQRQQHIQLRHIAIGSSIDDNSPASSIISSTQQPHQSWCPISTSCKNDVGSRGRICTRRSQDVLTSQEIIRCNKMEGGLCSKSGLPYREQCLEHRRQAKKKVDFQEKKRRDRRGQKIQGQTGGTRFHSGGGD